MRIPRRVKFSIATIWELSRLALLGSVFIWLLLILLNAAYPIRP